MFAHTTPSHYLRRKQGYSWPYSQPYYQYSLNPYQMSLPYQQYPVYQNSSITKNTMPYSNPYVTPYPVPTNNKQYKPSGVQSILTQFKKQDGTYDVNKMMDTAGQMIGTVNQISNMVKGLSKTFK